MHRLLRTVAYSKIERCYAGLSQLAFSRMLSRSSPTAPTQLMFSKQPSFEDQIISPTFLTSQLPTTRNMSSVGKDLHLLGICYK